MPKKKPNKDDLEERRQRIEALKAEAKSFGVQIDSDRLQNVAKAVNRIRKQREGKPPCYWRSYEKTARECRICEVRHECARGDEVPVEIVTEGLRTIACRKCGAGNLSVELRDPASGDVRDYGCTNAECTGTLANQQRHVTTEPKKKKIVAERVKGGNKPVIAKLAHVIAEHVRTHPGCHTRQIFDSISGSAERKQKQLLKFTSDGTMRREKVGRQYRYYLNDQ